MPKRKNGKLTKGEKLYCFYRARGHDQYHSIVLTKCYRCTSKHSYEQLANKMEHKVEIVMEIEQQKVEYAIVQGITTGVIRAGLFKIATNGLKEANRVQSWKLLGQEQGMFIDTVKHIDLPPPTVIDNIVNIRSEKDKSPLTR